MTTIRSIATSQPSDPAADRLFAQVMSASLLLIGALLASIGLFQQQGLLLGLGAIGLLAAASLRCSERAGADR